MEFTAKAFELKTAIRKAKPFVGRQKFQSIADNFLIGTGIYYGASLSSTDLDAEATVYFPSTSVTEAGEALVDTVAFESAVGSFKGEVTILTQEGSLIISEGNTRRAVPISGDWNNWPASSIVERTHVVSFESEVPKDAALVLPSAATDNNRPALSGVLIEDVGAAYGSYGARFVATDGFRLSRIELPAYWHSQDIKHLLVPARTLAQLLKVVKAEPYLFVDRLADGKIMFTTHTVRLVVREIEANFPDYKQVEPAYSEDATMFYFNDAALAIDAISRLVPSKRKADVRPLYLSNYHEHISLYWTDGEQREAATLVEDAYVEGDISVAVNPYYLLDALRAVGDSADIQVTAPDQPMLVRPDEGYATSVVMPMHSRTTKPEKVIERVWELHATGQVLE